MSEVPLYTCFLEFILASPVRCRHLSVILGHEPGHGASKLPENKPGFLPQISEPLDSHAPHPAPHNPHQSPHQLTPTPATIPRQSSQASCSQALEATFRSQALTATFQREPPLEWRRS